VEEAVTSLTETVELPDPAQQLLVHPLDVPSARRAFRNAWLISSFSNVAVCLCLAAIVWFVTESWLPPFLVFAATAGFGWLASRWSLREAWDHIPRKRQDRDRALPVPWSLLSSLILAIALTAATILLGFRLSRSDIPDGVREVCIGGGAAVCALVAVTILVNLVLRRRPLPAIFGNLLPLAGVTAGVVVAYYAMFGAGTIATWGSSSWFTVAIGAAIVVAADILHVLWVAIDSRRTRNSAAD
jgi:hypothetical protein